MRRLFIIGIIIVSLAYENYAAYILKSQQGKKYSIETDAQYNWYEAIHGCAARNASLIAIESSEKQKEISDMLEEYDFSNFRLWTSGNDNAATGTHQWLTTGQVFAYANWANNEPNNDSGNEHCVEFRPYDFKWNDVPCSIKIGYICEENLSTVELKRRCSDLYEVAKKADDQRLHEKQQQLEDLKKMHEKVLNDLLQSQRQKIEEADAQLEAVKKSHQEDLKNEVLRHNEELEAMTKFHVRLTDENKLELEELKKMHENVTQTLLEEKQNELLALKESSALEMTSALELYEKTCEKNSTMLIQEKIQQFTAEKDKEFDAIMQDYVIARTLKLAAIKKSHDNEMHRLRQEQEQELKALRTDCDEKYQKFVEEKQLEVATWQKVNELQGNRTNSYKFYNFVFHGNNYNKS